MLNIGLDFDDTVTADPGLWRVFVDEAVRRGHCVFVTTARHADNVADIEAMFPELEIIPSGGRLKKDAVEEASVSIDIWIDDSPGMIGYGD